MEVLAPHYSAPPAAGDSENERSTARLHELISRRIVRQCRCGGKRQAPAGGRPSTGVVTDYDGRPTQGVGRELLRNASTLTPRVTAERRTKQELVENVRKESVGSHFWAADFEMVFPPPELQRLETVGRQRKGRLGISVPAQQGAARRPLAATRSHVTPQIVNERSRDASLEISRVRQGSGTKVEAWRVGKIEAEKMARPAKPRPLFEARGESRPGRSFPLDLIGGSWDREGCWRKEEELKCVKSILPKRTQDRVAAVERP